MVASQELEVGDVLRRLKAEVSQYEPRRGKSTDRNTRSTSARCLELVTVCGIFLGICIFNFFRWYMCVSVCVCVFEYAVFSCNVLYIIQDKVTAFV